MWVRDDEWYMVTTANADSGSNSESASTRETALESEFDANSGSEADPERDSDSNGEDSDGDGSTSMADRLDTAATVIWAAFLGLVVVYALIPAVAVLVGVAPFAPTDRLPYVAFVGLTLVGTIAIIGTAIWDA